MRLERVTALALTVSALWTLFSASGAGPEAIRVLILSGQNNHDWQQTTPMLERVYLESERFTVEVTEDPASLGSMDLGRYDVIASNWTNYPSEERVWGSEAEQALLGFVRAGGGFVLFHAANACFSTWPEYRELAGAAWDMDKSGHASYHRFAVAVVDTFHPVTRGLEGFEIADELYHRLTIQPSARVLCTAYSDPRSHGTGRDEPVALVTRFGRGRCFNLVLGHDAAAMQHEGWRLLMLRGTEWAATGRVTIETPAGPEAALAAIRYYRSTDSRAPLRTVERLVQRAATQPRERVQLAARLAAMLRSDATSACKAFILDQLSLIGGPAEVPAIAGLLADEELGVHSLQALKRIGGEQARMALRAALRRLDGATRAGAVTVLGDLRDMASVGAIAQQLASRDDGLVECAADALAKIGGGGAARALLQGVRTTQPSRRAMLYDALLRCASTLERDGSHRDAAELYSSLFEPGAPSHVRASACAWLLRHGAAQEGISTALVALRTGELLLCASVARHIEEWADEGLARAVAAEFPRLPVEAQAQILPAICATLGTGSNLAAGGVATSPDGLEPDGQSGGDQAAIDGDLSTYWDETDNQAEYRLRIDLPEPTYFSGVRITGYQHHNYAPRDFDVVCDGVVAVTVRDAQYAGNVLTVLLPRTKCSVIELRISSSHGPSPAIRELELFDLPVR